MLNVLDYTITKQIYDSPNSIVYRAVRNEDQQPVIIKQLKADYPTPAELARYRHEFEILSQLELPGVVRVYDWKPYQKTLLLVIEDFGGDSLTFITKQNRLTLTELLPLLIQVADSLGQVHANDLIHKDINPNNLVCNLATRQVKLIDFGLASRLPRENPTLQSPNQLEGTLAYLSPEQTGRMNRTLDYRTDLYSLGVTFYELLTGRLPFLSKDSLEIVHGHIAKRPTPVIEINPQIPPILSDVVMKLMSKNAEDRYQSAFGLKYDLEHILANLHAPEKLSNFELAQQDISSKFHLPQKLYGREAEIETLLTTFDRVTEGGTQMVLVAGYSGIGKSVLVKEIYKSLSRTRGYFVTGKFDQFQRNVPYTAVVAAFSELVRQLLAEDKDSLAIWQENLSHALYPNGQVIIDVIPEMELIIGAQPPVPTLGPIESQNRFNLVFQNFIQVFSQPEHPLVIFFDDLQWVDSASLKLLEVMMLDHSPKSLLLIGAYRDNEVSPSHPLMITLDALYQENVSLTQMTLKPLAYAQINQLIADSLQQTPQAVESLSNLVSGKTGGNPFFVNQFLHTLYEENVLHFVLPTHTSQGGWQWDIRQIEALDITDNVVDLMVNKLRKLPTASQEVLRLAACVGNHFDLTTLAIIYEKSAMATFQEVMPIVTEGFILPTTGLEVCDEETHHSQFRFLHDRVQQAAYALISDAQKQSVHLRIGRLLLANTVTLEEQLFNIVDQYNEGLVLISDVAERLRLAELNLKAGKKAKESIAYLSSVQYLRTAIQLLPEDAWRTHYELTFTLHLERAESEFLSSNFAVAEQLTEELMGQAVSVADKLKIYHLQIELNGTQAKYLRALEIGFDALRLFEIELPPLSEITAESFLPEMEKFKHLLGDRAIDTLFDLPEMQDYRAKEVLLLLSKLGDLALIGHPNSYQVLTFIGVNFSLQYGNSSHSAFAYVLLGVIFITQFRDHITGHRLACMGIRLIEEKYPEPQLITKESAFFAWHINHWMANPLTNLEVSKRGFLKAMECGNLAFASYCYSVPAQPLFFTGAPLDNIILESNKSIEFCDAKKLTFISALSRTMKMMALSLQGKTQDYSSFSYQDQPETIDEAQFIADWEIVPMVAGTYYIRKLQNLCLFGEYEKALAYFPSVDKHIGGCGGHITTAEYHFYRALAILSLYSQHSTTCPDYSAPLQASRDFIKKCADQCEGNFLFFQQVLDAETACYEGKELEAMALYDQAMTVARESHFVQYEAIANELAAKFYFSKGRKQVAAVYLHEALYYYQLWGATAKAQHLQTLYPQLPLKQRPSGNVTNPFYTLMNPTNTTLSTNTTGVQELGLSSITKVSQTPSDEIVQHHLPIATNFATFSTQTCTATSGFVSGGTDWLDLTSVMKAAQALSDEMVLENLLTQMMHTVIENAGAQRGVLILEQHGQWRIQAEITVQPEMVTVLQSKQIEGEMPIMLLNYVIRTKQSVVFEDLQKELKYQEDDYVRTHHLKSVLCLTLLHQQKLVGVIYLENNLTTGVFTPARSQVLTLLSSQMAISLNNARFVRELEQARQAAEAANHAKTAFLSNVSHELRTPLNSILGYSQLLQHTAQLTTEQQELVQEIYRSGEHLLVMVSDILDISRLQTARLELQVTDVYLSQLLKDLVVWFSDQAREKGLAFHYEPDLHLPTGILADMKRLRQILHHLLSNAVKFTQHGSITFQVHSTPATDTPEVHHFEFIVADTGIGMTEAALSRLFTPFEQASDWLHKSAGTGLGLSLAKQLIELMGGQIQIHSQPNVGTRFTVQLDFVKSQEWQGLDPQDEVAETLPETPPLSADTLETMLSLKGPTADQAAELCNLARKGDFFEILELVTQLEQEDAELQPFATQIRHWAENFRDEPIEQLARQFIKSSATESQS